MKTENSAFCARLSEAVLSCCGQIPHQDSAGLLQPPSLMEEEAGLLSSTPSVQKRPRGKGSLSLRNVWDSLTVKTSEGPEALPLQCVGAAVQVARGGAAHQDAASCWRYLPRPGFSRSLREAENCWLPALF